MSKNGTAEPVLVTELDRRVPTAVYRPADHEQETEAAA